jgi:hypothetical protein
MATVDRGLERGPEGGVPVPYRAVLAGVGITFAALVVQLGSRGQLGGPAVAVALGGLLVAGAGLATGLKRWREGAGAGGLWALAAVACGLGHVAVGPAWDSLALLLTVAAWVAGAAALLAVLPARWRRLALSLAIAAHFAAIATAVAVVPPRDGNAPWLAQQVWTRFARPYLLFTNLNNGYHFYAPDPGPTSLLWFRVQYADGTSRWVRIPDHSQCDTHIEARRWGALCTFVGQSAPADPRHFEEVVKLRQKRPDIPAGPGPAASQYRPPTTQAQILIADYAGYVARTAAHPEGEGPAVTGVKVYRVDYHNPPIKHFADGHPPIDPAQYQPFYMGEFDASGKIKPESLKLTHDSRGILGHTEQDPLLYWLIPIVRVKEDGSPAEPGEGRVINFVRKHAGDPDEESVP